jgi:hypothetical protein
MTKYSEIADKIKNTYENPSVNLNPKYALHWYIRRFRISGEKKYTKLISQNMNKMLPKMLNSLDAATSDEKCNIYANHVLKAYKITSPRRQRRASYYSKHPEVITYALSVLYLFVIKSLGLDTNVLYKDKFEEALKYLSTKNIYKLFLDKELIKADPSECANIIYNAYYLGLFDKRNDLLNIYNEYWVSLKPNDNYEWLDKIYALTHIIIATSNYYQNFVNYADYKTILNYFEKDIENIARNVNVDSLGEVGLCFKLAGIKSNDIIDKVKIVLMEHFNEEIGYIPHDKYVNNLNKSEHRNIIANMVLSDFDRLYKGPYLGDKIL